MIHGFMPADGFNLWPSSDAPQHVDLVQPLGQISAAWTFTTFYSSGGKKCCADFSRGAPPDTLASSIGDIIFRMVGGNRRRPPMPGSGRKKDKGRHEWE